jgi:hypothetical protein
MPTSAASGNHPGGSASEELDGEDGRPARTADQGGDARVSPASPGDVHVATFQRPQPGAGVAWPP